ncbi:MAG TPA: hypothetical protein PLQ44_03475 [Candidatus Paceibacterota bacterium]|nr:hypothetical protein [Candidatus Paceibacterota bacterium]
MAAKKNNGIITVRKGVEYIHSEIDKDKLLEIKENDLELYKILTKNK